jgi:hypothetical protein
MPLSSVCAGALTVVPDAELLASVPFANGAGENVGNALESLLRAASVIVVNMVPSIVNPSGPIGTMVELHACGGVMSVSVSVIDAFGAVRVTPNVSVRVTYTVGYTEP